MTGKKNPCIMNKQQKKNQTLNYKKQILVGMNGGYCVKALLSPYCTPEVSITLYINYWNLSKNLKKILCCSAIHCLSLP